MKISWLIFFIIWIGVAGAGSYNLGPYQVSFNLSTAEDCVSFDPVHQYSIDAWLYVLNVTPYGGGGIQIAVEESSPPLRADAIENYAAMRMLNKTNEGIAGYQNQIIDYKGHMANSEYFPAQYIRSWGGPKYIPETFGLMFLLDNQTVIVVEGTGISADLYDELLNSLETRKTNAALYHKPYVGSTNAYAGIGKGSKPGMIEKNMLVYPASGSMATPRGIGA
jgi:hypothetical protein